MKSYPDLLCKVCHLRAEEARIKVNLFEKKRYLFCRICKSSAHLITGIEEVVGLIGGNVKDYKRDGKRFYVNLWDEETKSSRNADIDRLMIVNTDGITYDWAIASVITTLKERGSGLDKMTENSKILQFLKIKPTILRVLATQFLKNPNSRSAC